MFSVLKKFNILLEKGQKKRIAVLIVLMVIGAFLETLGVTLMVPMMTAIMQPDIIETNEMVAWVCGILDLHSHTTFVIVCIAALIVVFIIKDLFLIGEYYVQTRFISNNRFKTQVMLLEAFINRPYEYFLNADSGEILRVIGGDTGTTYALLTTLLGFFTEGIVSIALVVTIFVVDPIMSLIVAVTMGLTILVIAKVIRPTLKKNGLKNQKHSALTSKWLIQAINGIKETKIAQKEQFFQDRYNYSGNELIKIEKYNGVMSQAPRLLIEMVSVCSMLGAIAIMILNGRSIESLMPSLGAFAMAAVKLMPSANRIMGAITAISFQTPALDKMIENLREVKDLNLGNGVADGNLRKNTKNAVKTTNVGNGQSNSEARTTDNSTHLTFNTSIQMSNITYRYPNAHTNVLEGANLTVPIGKSVGIVGTSGAGKTTAVDIILGLLDPQEGQVLVDGVDVRENYHEWLNHIGYIPQAIFMLDDTIRANVAFGFDKDDIDDGQVWHALEEAQLADYVRSLPDGINTSIGERGVRVSGGQRQRIGIARALYTNPDILFFDEATSALDNETEAAIMESINSLHGKKTMFIIAHRLQTIEQCDMVFRVQDGHITQER